MSPPRALDLYCAGGGAGRGLELAGFEVVGWDIDDMSRYYPGEFHRGDVLELEPAYVAEFDLVWSSPPCQAHSIATRKWPGRADEHLDLIPQTRELLDAAGVPYVIENVPGAPLRVDLMLCGLMVGLPLLRRHRVFELVGFQVQQPEHPRHEPNVRYITVAGHPGGSSARDGVNGFGSTAEWRAAMEIDWLPARLIAQAIPPAYSRLIGAAAIAELGLGVTS